MENIKTIFINATRDTTDGFLGKKTLDDVNGEALASSIETACNDLVSKKYTILSVFPISSGGHNFKTGPGYGYGYGYTSGVIIIAKTQ